MKFKLLFCIILVILGVFISSCISRKYIEGIVTDFNTKKPIPDAQVTVSRIGWGIRDGSLVWDKAYVYEGRTDQYGNFKIAYGGSSAEVSLTKEGYNTYRGYHDSNNRLIIKIKKHNPQYVALSKGLLEIGVQNFRPYGWNFAEQRITFNQAEADLFPLFDNQSNFEHIRLETTGKGGIAFVSVAELGVSSDFLVYTDMAPNEGYTPTVELNLRRDSEGPAGVYFIRTHEGEHFAKLYFGPSGYGLVGSEQDNRQGTWGLQLEYVYNPQVSRNLEFQK